METFTYISDFTLLMSSEWKTLVSQMDGAVKQYRQQRKKRMASWSLVFKERTLEDSLAIMAFFDRHHGQADAFYWANPLENDEIYTVRFSSDKFGFDYNDGLRADFKLDIEEDVS